MNRGDFIGFWNDTYQYAVRMPPDWMPQLERPQRKTICKSCMVRWLWPSVAEHQDGMCHVCWKAEYDGTDDILLEKRGE